LFSYHSIISIQLAQTPPDAIHPSKNQEYSIGVCKEIKWVRKIAQTLEIPNPRLMHTSYKKLVLRKTQQ
jgi:hypothetical protein